jgi:hypothetical protein
MGLFSRKDKAPKPDPPSQNSYSNNSIHSNASKSIINRVSAGSVGPGTPLSPKTPFKMPKVDLPRPPDPQLDPAGYLKCLPAVRERSKIIFDKAMRDELNHFDVDMSKLPDVVSFVSGLIKVSNFLLNSRFATVIRSRTPTCQVPHPSCRVTEGFMCWRFCEAYNLKQRDTCRVYSCCVGHLVY